MPSPTSASHLAGTDGFGLREASDSIVADYDDERTYPTGNSSIRSSTLDSSIAGTALRDDLGDGDTFDKLLSIHLDHPISSLTISPANRDVALGARAGLFIVDLSNPYDSPRFVPFRSKWQPADIQWNPWPTKSEWVASTSNQQAIIYNLSSSPSLGSSPVEHVLHAHTRAISDINWSPSAPEILATTALDGRVFAWDLRSGRKPVWGVFSDSPGTQVKWNRTSSHLIASAHDSRVLIWDDRKTSIPVDTIHAHSAKIYGIDWSRRKSDALLTCSLDKSFKYWSTHDLSSPLLTVNTSAPVWRARYLPFGRGVLTIPERSDYALSIWGRTKLEQGNTATSVARFEGSADGVQEFVWRTRGGENLDQDNRQFQLVTWSKDRRLRLWPISDEILREVGHVKGSKITVKMTRRNCPDISYRTFGEAPAPPRHLQPSIFSLVTRSPLTPSLLAQSSTSLSSSPVRPSLLTSSLLSANLNPASSSALNRKRSASMTITRVRNRSQRANDRLAWMTGVKVLQSSSRNEPQQLPDQIITSPANANVPDLPEPPMPPSLASSIRRGTTETGTLREGGDTERGDSVIEGGSKATGTAKERDSVRVGLGEEITSVVRRFPHVNFEKVHVAGRSCTVSLYMTSSSSLSSFLRATFSFPRTYPHASATIEIERSTDINLKSRAFLLQSVRRLMAIRMSRNQPSFEVALRYLLGDRSVLDSLSVEKEDDDDDEEEEDDDEGNGAGRAGQGATLYNVPPPRRGGASFGPQGQLVIFFPTNLFAPSSDNDGQVEKDDLAADLSTSVASLSSRPPRLSEAFGSMSYGEEEEDADYVETDEALQYLGIAARPLSDPKRVKATPEDDARPFSSVVHIRNVAQHLIVIDHDRVMCSLELPIVEAARLASRTASARGDFFLTRLWSTMESLFETGDEDERSSAVESQLAIRLLPELISFLRRVGDIQVLGVIACLLESYRRTLDDIESERAKTPTDYFNHHSPQARSYSSSRQSRTPFVHAQKYDDSPSRLRSASPLRSWTSLSGLFNSSVLSLRSHVSPGLSTTSSSPDQSHFPFIPPLSSRIRINSSPNPAPQLSSPRSSRFPMRRTTSNSPGRKSADARPSLSTGSSSAQAKSRISPNVTFGKTSVAVIAPTRSEHSESRSATGQVRKRVAIELVNVYENRQSKAWWLTEQVQVELELYRFAYAELLFRWNDDTARLRVLELCRTASQDHQKMGEFARELLRSASGIGQSSSIVILRSCSKCSAEIVSPLGSCASCSTRQSLICSLCHLPLPTLLQTCTLCHHVGHIDCITGWFSKLDFCPAGCGCSCLSEGGLSGSFMLSAAPPTPAAAESVSPTSYRKGAGMRNSLPYFA